MQRIILIIIVALVSIGVIWWYQAQVPVAGPTVSVTNMQQEDLKTEIESIDVGDLDADFKEIDTDISTL